MEGRNNNNNNNNNSKIQHQGTYGVAVWVVSGHGEWRGATTTAA